MVATNSENQNCKDDQISKVQQWLGSSKFREDMSFWVEVAKKNGDTLLDMCVSSLRRGHANLLCIVPILADEPSEEGSNHYWMQSPLKGLKCSNTFVDGPTFIN